MKNEKNPMSSKDLSMLTEKKSILECLAERQVAPHPGEANQTNPELLMSKPQ